MRIAFMVNSFPAISETFVLDQITGLIDRGHEVDVYAAERGDGPTAHDDVAAYGLLARARYYPRMPGNYLLRALKGLALVPARYWRRPTACLRALNVFRYGAFAASLRPLYGAVPFLPGRSYDVVHCHHGWNGTLGAVLVDMGLLKGKLVVTLHGFDMSAHLRRAGENAYRFLFERADLLLPVSECWRRRLVELGCDERKIRVHRMGVDLAKWAFAPRAPAFARSSRDRRGGSSELRPDKPDADETIRIATVGRLVEKKGVEFGIRAVAKLLAKGDRIEYTVVGDGPLRGRLLALARELGAGDAVKLVGPRTRGEVVEILARTHVFLAPSVTAADGDQEGLPVVLMEAMATGAPLVATRHSGIPELVEDGVSGFLVPERDADALAAALGRLVAHPAEWAGLGRAARAAVEERHDAGRLNDELVRTFERLLDGGGSE